MLNMHGQELKKKKSVEIELVLASSKVQNSITNVKVCK
jgi:hypothetical protein